MPKLSRNWIVKTQKPFEESALLHVNEAKMLDCYGPILLPNGASVYYYLILTNEPLDWKTVADDCVKRSSNATTHAIGLPWAEFLSEQAQMDITREMLASRSVVAGSKLKIHRSE